MRNASKRKVLFPGQQADEEIYLVTRQHWLVMASQFAVWFIFVILLVVFDFLTGPNFPFLEESPARQTITLLKLIYVMFLVAGLFSIWILYYLNMQVVTNQRIVDITQKNFLNHTTSELNLSRIQDVTAEIRGFLGTFFNYGNIYVQTAGETARFEFNNVPDPHKIAKLILDLYEKFPHHENSHSSRG